MTHTDQEKLEYCKKLLDRKNARIMMLERLVAQERYDKFDFELQVENDVKARLQKQMASARASVTEWRGRAEAAESEIEDLRQCIRDYRC